CVGPRSPLRSTVIPRSSRSRWNGRSDASNGNARGSAAQIAINAVGSCTRRTAPGSVEPAAATIIGPVIAIGPAQALIGLGGVPACPIELSRARRALLRSSLLSWYGLQAGTLRGKPSEATHDQSRLQSTARGF